MTDFTSATPSLVLDQPSSADSFALILQAADAALVNHGSKNYVEKIDFVDIILDIRKIAFQAVDLLED
jgi:hypothetical protein